MDRDYIDRIIASIVQRNLLLPEYLLDIKSQLEIAYDKNALESGVINRGYYEAFSIILRQLNTPFHIQEEQYTHGGRILKIPVVDIFYNNANTRIFILTNSIIKDWKLG